ncbi:hypothetical protein CLU79DRAFT_831029 [Phycomyces nitens]|nr:hypothetical protein CLU79DRAFT_831029 [Phycomyces nitens]
MEMTLIPPSWVIPKPDTVVSIFCSWTHVESNTPWVSSHEEIDVDYEIEYGELRAPVKNSMLQLVFQVGPHGCASRNVALVRIGCEYCEVLKFDLTRQRPVGLYWFDGYRPAHFGVWAQQEGKHSVAYFMMDIKSEGDGEACPLLIGPWLHRCFAIHYLGNRQVVRNRMYPSPSVFDLAPADMVSDLSSFVQPTKVYRRHHSALWSSASGLPALCSVVSKFPVIGFRSRISLFAGFSAAGSCLRGGIKCP